PPPRRRAIRVGHGVTERRQSHLGRRGVPAAGNRRAHPRGLPVHRARIGSPALITPHVPNHRRETDPDELANGDSYWPQARRSADRAVGLYGVSHRKPFRTAVCDDARGPNAAGAYAPKYTDPELRLSCSWTQEALTPPSPS